MVGGELFRDGRAMRILMRTGGTTAVRAATSRSPRTTRFDRPSSGPAARLPGDASPLVPITAPNSTT